MIAPHQRDPLIFPSQSLFKIVPNMNDSMSAAGIGCVCIVGLGFVGESLLRQFSQAYPTIGFDMAEKRVEELRAKFRDQEDLKLTSNEMDLRRATHYLLAVPTSPRADYSVDLSHLKLALSTVVRHASPGSTIVIESSVSVGTTRALFDPLGHIFHAGISPERHDLGQKAPAGKDIPKLVAGLTPQAQSNILALYSTIFRTVVPVLSPEVAEMTMLFENSYRMVNIAYVNEVSDACRTLGLDPHEVIDAASTKPFGFQAFRPSLGIGGHSVPVNALYLLAKCENLPVLKQSTKIMRNRPRKLARELHGHIMSVNLASSVLQPRVLIIGMSFESGGSVLSYLPAVDFASELDQLGCERLVYYDPLVSDSELPWIEKLADEAFNSIEVVTNFDVVAVCTRQRGVDYGMLSNLPSEMVWYYD